MIRLATNGRDVTGANDLWSDTDIIITQTNYRHPDITSGMHTNGPASVWVRFGDVDEWTCCGQYRMFHILRAWNIGGREAVMNLLEALE